MPVTLPRQMWIKRKSDHRSVEKMENKQWQENTRHNLYTGVCCSAKWLSITLNWLCEAEKSVSPHLRVNQLTGFSLNLLSEMGPGVDPPEEHVFTSGTCPDVADAPGVQTHYWATFLMCWGVGLWAHNASLNYIINWIFLYFHFKNHKMLLIVTHQKCEF